MSMFETASEEAFSRYLNCEGIPYEYLGRCHESPDFKVWVGSQPVFAEVKEWKENPASREAREQLRDTGGPVQVPKIKNLVQRIKKCSSQFKKYARKHSGSPFILVVQDQHIPLVFNQGEKAQSLNNNLRHNEVHWALYGDRPMRHDTGFVRRPGVFREDINRSLSAVAVLGPVRDVLLHDPVRMREEWDMLRGHMWPALLAQRHEEELRLADTLKKEDDRRLDIPRRLAKLEKAQREKEIQRSAEARRSGDGWRLGLAVYHNPYARHQIPLLFESLGKATIQNHYRYKYYIPAEYGGGDNFWMAHLSPDPNHSDEDGPLGRPRLRT